MKWLIVFLSVFLFGRCTVDYKTYIPNNAKKLIPYVYSESKRLLPNFDLYSYFPALIEHESCITLCSKRCWNAKSRLKTSREEGAGLGQITRAWKNGKLRFDTLAYLKRRYRKELNGLNWKNIYDKPRLQIRAMVLLWRSNYLRFPKSISFINRLAFSDASYNQGYYRTYKDRQLCKLTRNCNPKIWFNNVELTCTASKRKLYGNRSACDISRHHVRDVFTRIFKYYFYYVKQHYTKINKKSIMLLLKINNELTRK